MTVTLTSGELCTDTSLRLTERDELQWGVPDGSVRLFDIAMPYSFPAQSAPVDDSLIRDPARAGGTGLINIPAGESLGFAGGGLDFAGVDAVPTGVFLPGGIEDIVAEQEFLQCMYVKLPPIGEWPAAASISQMIAGDSVALPGNPAGETQLATIVMVTQDTSATRPRIWFRRQTALGQNFNSLFFGSTETIPLDELVQLSCWRKDGVFYGRIRSSGLDVTKSVAAAANNTANLTGRTVCMGRTSISNAAYPSYHTLYRGFIENLAASGRDPAAVLDEDWARTVARVVFS